MISPVICARSAGRLTTLDGNRRGAACAAPQWQQLDPNRIVARQCLARYIAGLLRARAIAHPRHDPETATPTLARPGLPSDLPGVRCQPHRQALAEPDGVVTHR